jgi:hypothetical protein
MSSDGMPRQRRTPVMRDVARLAGVSHQTVSRVLNASPMVSDDVRRSSNWGTAGTTRPARWRPDAP